MENPDKIKPHHGAIVVSKASKAYWLPRVFRPAIGEWSGDNFSVRMSCGGIQRTLSTGTPSREAAAATARDWYAFLSRERSWASFDAKYRNPDLPGAQSGRNAVKDTLTLGAYLAAVRAEASRKRKRRRWEGRRLRFRLGPLAIHLS